MPSELEFKKQLAKLSIEQRLYTLNALPEHLHFASAYDVLRQLLTYYAFLQAKVDACGVGSLLADYEFLPNDPPSQAVGSALRLAAHVLAADSTQLAGQLLGRLDPEENPVIKALCESAQQRTGNIWLRPQIPSLLPPGGALLQTLTDPAGKFSAITVTHEDHQVISANEQGILCIWDLSNYQPLRVWKGDSVEITALAIMHKTHLVTGSKEGRIHVWNLRDGTLQQTIQLHLSSSLSLQNTLQNALDEEKFQEIKEYFAILSHITAINVVSSDPPLIACMLLLNEIQIWNLNSGDLQHTIDAPGCVVMAVTRDNKQLIYGDTEGVITVWDIESGLKLQTLNTTLRPPTYYERLFARNMPKQLTVLVPISKQEIVYGSPGRLLTLWNLESGRLIPFPADTTMNPIDLFFSSATLMPNSQQLITGGDDGTIRVWDMLKRDELRTLGIHHHTVKSIEVTSDGRRLVSNDRSSLKIWDLVNEKPINRYRAHTTPVTAIAIAPDGKTAVSGEKGGKIYVWDVLRGEALYPMAGHESWVKMLIVTPDGQCAASISGNKEGGTLYGWTLSDGRRIRTRMSNTGNIRAISITPDGKWIISGGEDGKLRIWDVNSGQEIRTLPGDSPRITAVTILADGQRVISGAKDGTLVVWDLFKGTLVQTLHGNAGRVEIVRPTLDNRYAVSAGFEAPLKVWDLQLGKELHTLQNKNDAIMEITPDGRLVIAPDERQSICVWEILSGKLVYALEGHSGSVFTLAMCGNSQLLLSGGEDGLKIWDLEKGVLLTSFTTDNTVNCSAIAADGETIVAGDASGNIHFLKLNFR